MHGLGDIFSESSLRRTKIPRDVGQEDPVFNQFFSDAAYIVYLYVHLLSHLIDIHQVSIIAEDSRVYDTWPFI